MNEQVVTQSESSKLKAVIDAVEGQFKGLRDMFAKGLITEGEFKTKVSDLHAEVAAMNHADLTPLDMALERLEIAKVAQAEARKGFVALLPEATPAHLEVIVRCTRDAAVIPVGYRPDADVRLTETQKAAVKAAADARKTWLTANRDVVLDEVKEQAGDLTGYTIRVGSNTTTTKLTFTKSHGDKPTGAKAGSRAIVSNYAAIASRNAAKTE